MTMTANHVGGEIKKKWREEEGEKKAYRNTKKLSDYVSGCERQ